MKKVLREKKFVPQLSLIGLAGLTLLAACGGDDDGNTGGANGDDGELSGEIEVWGWNIAAASLEIAAEEFMAEHENVEIDVRDIGDSELYERLTVGMGSGGSGLPDVFMIHSDELAGYVEQFPNEFLNLSEMGFDEHADEFAEFKTEIVTNEEGDFVAFPWDIGPAGVFYRVDMFEEAGVDPDSIETWDDYIEAGEIIKEELDVYLMPLEVTHNDQLYRIMMNQQGASYYTEDGAIDIESEESQRAMEKIQEMYERGLATNVNDWDAQIGAVANSHVASIPIAVWYTGTMMDQAPDLSGDIDAFRLPAFEEGGNQAANIGGSDLAIPASTDNPDLAYAFSEYFVTDEDIQLEAFEQYGLFPSLVSTYNDPYFEEGVEYFNDSPIFSLFADIAEEVEPAVYNEDFARGQDVLSDAQAQIMLDGQPVDQVLSEAADRLESETGRERVN